MSVPQPPKALEGRCSAIDNDTLYVLSPTGLQSLPLKQNSTWTEEPSGESVTGPACVTVVPHGDESQAALYVIGGTSSNESYSGLQRYVFRDKTWETLPTPANVLQSRTSHSATYLNDSQSILVYAGSQPDAPSDLSSQTFLVGAHPPYNIQSFTSEAPPANMPILEPWNSSHAAMMGGTKWNTAVFTFGPSDGWSRLGTNLSQPIDSNSRATVLSGSDGSKVLELYDFSVSPNVVSQTVLLDANGATAPAGQTIGGGQSSRKRKRDLTLNNWPAYNSTDAPTATRTEYSIAQGADGMAVVAGGNSDAPVALFDQTGNNWIDADQFFRAENQQPLQPSPSSTSASSAVPTSSANPSSSSSSGLSPHNKMLRSLGIALGVLFGVAALFVLILLFLRWRRMRRRKEQGYIDEKAGNRLSFADRGASFMRTADDPPPKSGHPMDGSRSSYAILAGKLDNKRDISAFPSRSSYDSTSRLVKDKNGSTVASGPGTMLDIGEKTPVYRKDGPPRLTLTPLDEKDGADEKKDRSRSSGWSKYFATSGPTGPQGVSHLPAAYIKPHTISSSTYGSDYSNSSQVPSLPSRILSSALVAPLGIDFSKTMDGQRLSQVTSGSPSFSDSREDLAKRGSNPDVTRGQQGLIIDPSLDRKSHRSGHSLSTNNRTTTSSGLSSDFYREFGVTQWTPTSPTFKDPINRPRPPSSAYTNSVADSRVPSRGNGSGFFPGAGVSYRPKTKLSPILMSDFPAPPQQQRTVHPTARGSQAAAALPADDRDSVMTTFPRGVPSAYYADRQAEAPGSPPLAPSAPKRADQKPVMSDMSWLNLGLGNHQSNKS